MNAGLPHRKQAKLHRSHKRGKLSFAAGRIGEQHISQVAVSPDLLCVQESHAGSPCFV